MIWVFKLSKTVCKILCQFDLVAEWPNRVPYRVPSKSISIVCPHRVDYLSAVVECNIRLPHRVPLQSAPKECPTQSTHLECPIE